MSDYVSCPACHGSGLIPLKDAESIGAARQAQDAERVRADWEHRRAMVEMDNAIRQRTLQQRTEAAERRFAELEAALYGSSSGPQEEAP